MQSINKWTQGVGDGEKALNENPGLYCIILRQDFKNRDT